MKITSKRSRLALLTSLGLLALALVGLGGCVTAVGGGLGIYEPIEFEYDDGEVAFEIEPQAGSVDIEDAAGRVLARYRMTEGRVAIHDAEDVLLGYVIAPDPRDDDYRVVASDGMRLLLSLEREADGDLEIEDPRGNKIYQMKKRDYGFKVLLSNGVVESRVKSDFDKVKVRDDDGTTILKSNRPMTPEAAVVLSLEKVPFEYAAGLAIAVSHFGY